MQGRYARTRANGALRPPRRPRAAARAGALCFGVCARLPKSVADEQVCLFAVVDLRSSGSEPRSSTQFKARGAMARFVVQNRHTDAEAIKDFDVGGYAWQKELSTPEKPVFVRPYPTS